MESVANAIMKVKDTSQGLFTFSFEEKNSQSLTFNFLVSNISFLKKEEKKSNAKAKEEIFITDWWLSPELRLKVIPNNDDIKQSFLFEPFLESAGEEN